METGNEIITIGQAARYLGISTSGSLDGRPITLRQLKSMVDGTKASSVKLPDGYTQLQWIQSDGTNWIDTGIVPDTNTGYILDMGISGFMSGDINHILSVWNGDSFVLRSNAAQDGFSVRCGKGDLVDISLGGSVSGRYIISLDGEKITVNNDKSATVPRNSFNIGGKTLYLFAGHAGTNDKATQFTKMKLNSLLISGSSGVVAQFTPCRDASGKIGVYDNINDNFISNAGGNPFVAGPDVTISELDTRLATISQLKRIEIGPTIVSWADGTDEEISAMVDAADAGKLNLSDYWSAGDTRTVRLSAMSASVSNGSEAHVAQNVRFVLTDPGHYTLANGRMCNFVVLQKDSLLEGGFMHAQGTNHRGWEECPRRTWCNSVYRNSIPSTLLGIFKQFKVYTGANSFNDDIVESVDWFSFFSEKEVFGSTLYANKTGESKNTQLDWYKIYSNRIKLKNGKADSWWERSMTDGYYLGFCAVNHAGHQDRNTTELRYGLAPFGCI